MKTEQQVLDLIAKTFNSGDWDSLGHLDLLVSLDKLFDGMVAPLKDLSTAKSAKEVINILRENALIE